MPIRKVSINIFGLHVRQWASKRAVPIQKLFDCMAKAVNGSLAKSALMLGPTAVFVQLQLERNLLGRFAKIAEISQPAARSIAKPQYRSPTHWFLAAIIDR